MLVFGRRVRNPAVGVGRSHHRRTHRPAVPVRHHPLCAKSLLEHPHPCADARAGRAGRCGLARRDPAGAGRRLPDRRPAPADRLHPRPVRRPHPGLRHRASPAPQPPPPRPVSPADLFDAATLACVIEHRVPVNAGSMDMLHQLGPRSPGHAVWLRINPGFGHGHSHKTNTGGEPSKHGIWPTDLPAALAAIRQHGLDLVGLHMHIGSGVDYRHLAQVCDALVALGRGVRAAGHDLRAISAGGGLSVPYRSGDPVVDTAHYHGLWEAARQQAQAIIGHPLTLEIRPGRYLVAESGVLLAAVCATKQVGSNHFVLLDAGFNELLRPSMYGSYHAMSLLRRDGASAAGRPTVVAGPLCEAGDVFTQSGDGLVLPRDLPPAEVGDLLLIHDTGAYGATMSSNYNTRPLSAEALVEGAQARLIRRRQTVDELLALERGL